VRTLTDNLERKPHTDERTPMLTIHPYGCIINSMKFSINYWRNPSGKAPVEKYIDDIDNKEEIADILTTLKGVQLYGTYAVGVEFRQIEGKLWELKIKTHGNQHRIFYVVLKGNEMYLLHAYLKKTPRAPINEIMTARQRMKQLMEDRK
jgi:phage-related protein